MFMRCSSGGSLVDLLGLGWNSRHMIWLCGGWRCAGMNWVHCQFNVIGYECSLQLVLLRKDFGLLPTQVINVPTICFL